MTALVRPGFNTSLPGASIIARARPLFWAPRVCGSKFSGLRFLGKLLYILLTSPRWRSRISTVLGGKYLQLLLFSGQLLHFRSTGHWARAITRAMGCVVRRRGPRPSRRIIPLSVPSYPGGFLYCPGFTGSCPGPIRVRSGPVQAWENR